MATLGSPSLSSGTPWKPKGIQAWRARGREEVPQSAQPLCGQRPWCALAPSPASPRGSPSAGPLARPGSGRRGSWHLLRASRPGAGSGPHPPRTPGAAEPDRPAGRAQVASARQVGVGAAHPRPTPAGIERPRAPRDGWGVGGPGGLRGAARGSEDPAPPCVGGRCGDKSHH